jgi:hypothetical protein
LEIKTIVAASVSYYLRGKGLRVSNKFDREISLLERNESVREAQSVVKILSHPTLSEHKEQKQYDVCSPAHLSLAQRLGDCLYTQLCSVEFISAYLLEQYQAYQTIPFMLYQNQGKS